MLDKKDKLNFCVGVIWFNPTKEDINRLSILKKCFKKIYIYDNSPISNEKYLSNELMTKKVEYFYNGKNEGISIPFNFIAKRARKYDFLLALDQDTEIEEKAIINLKKYIENNFSKNIGIYCPNIYFEIKPEVNHISDSIQNTITSCSMLNLNIFNKLGGFDKNIFLDGVDREYCFRLKKNNYEIIRINNILIKQNLGKGKKNIFGIYEHSAFRNYYIAYNRWYFIEKYPEYFKQWRKIKYLYLSTIKQMLSVLLCETDKRRKIIAIIKANQNYIRDKRKKKKK